jgi:predicted DNA-binding transcriptional regulator AlpA
MTVKTGTAQHPDAMLTTDEAADLLNLRPQTLHEWRSKRIGPAYLRLGARAVRYRAADLWAWAEAQRVEPLG